MISINATLVVQVLHFLLLMVILNRIMLRPIMNQIHEREEYVRKARTDSEEMVSEAERLKEKRRYMEMEARRKAVQERAGLKEEALAVAEGIFAETYKEIKGIREQIDARVQKEMEKAQAALSQETAVLADEIVERIAGRRIGH